MTSVWETAWESAQPRLAAFRDTVLSYRTPNARIIRVGQLDSELLDQELVSLLQEPLSKALSTISTSLRACVEPELCLLIQLTLYKLSVWNTGASYGAKLQDLRYAPRRSAFHANSPSTPSGLPQRLLLVHGALTVLVPYIHTRLRAHALSNAWPDAPSSDCRRKAWLVLATLESTHSLAGLLGFVAFLWDGRYRTIADRWLGMRLVSARKQVRRDVSYEFMNRQMVWHSFTEFLLFLLPLIKARTLRRQFTRLSSRLLTTLTPAAREKVPKSTAVKHGPYWSLPLDQCAICAENASFSSNLADPSNAFTAALTGTTISRATDPLTETPESEREPPPFPLNTLYVASCGDTYCYHCIAERMMRAADDDADGASWECLRCLKPVQMANRMEGNGTSQRSRSSPESDLTDFGEDDDDDFGSRSDLDMSIYSESSQ